MFVKARSVLPSQLSRWFVGHLGDLSHPSSLEVAGWNVPRPMVEFPGLGVSWNMQAGLFSVAGAWCMSAERRVGCDLVSVLATMSHLGGFNEHECWAPLAVCVLRLGGALCRGAFALPVVGACSRTGRDG